MAEERNVAKIEAALRAVKVYTTQAQGVIINYRLTDTDAIEALKEAFGFAGGTSFMFNGKLAPFGPDDDVWMDRMLPSHIYDIARPICLEQEAARRAAA